MATTRMVKENSNKPEQKRVYDVDGFKKRAACVCVKNENETEVLLISSSRNNNHWIVPGGGIEDNENPEDAAAREVYEEAGVKGRLGRFLGVFESVNRKHRTSVFILIVDKEFEDWEEHIVLGRKRKWFNLTEARQELEKHKPVQGTYLSFLKGYSTASNSSIANTNNSIHNYFNNHTNSNTENNRSEIRPDLCDDSDDNNGATKNGSSGASSSLHTYGNMSHQTYSFITNYRTYNSPHSPTSHLEHDLLATNTNTASLLNTNTI